MCNCWKKSSSSKALQFQCYEINAFTKLLQGYNGTLSVNYYYKNNDLRFTGIAVIMHDGKRKTIFTIDYVPMSFEFLQDLEQNRASILIHLITSTEKQFHKFCSCDQPRFTILTVNFVDYEVKQKFVSLFKELVNLDCYNERMKIYEAIPSDDFSANSRTAVAEMISKVKEIFGDFHGYSNEAFNTITNNLNLKIAIDKAEAALFNWLKYFGDDSKDSDSTLDDQ